MIFSFRNRFPNLNPLWDKYAALQQRAVFPARTILLHEGKTAQNYYFVEKGCLRLWFDGNGKDITVQFFFENEGVSSLESFQKNIPSMFSIETIEATTVQVLSKKLFSQMINEMGEDPEFMKVLLEISFERQRHYMSEFLSRIRDTPEQRYANLIKERPHIVQRVPQHYIASYLGITSVHLSRIKNKQAKKNRPGGIR
ncbi:MAG TPA: Crp/Fnr family transcriptional regulator [Puia sp.]|nr:Crp/Fnr family transcriptional regulator [Puia sp.]